MKKSELKKIIEEILLESDSYPKNFFKRSSVISKANQFGLIDIENEDLTLKGLIQKAIEWDEEEHGIESYIYNVLKKDIEKLGGKMPKSIRRKK